MAKKTTSTATLAEATDDLQERRKMADLVAAQIRTTFGNGSIMKMNEVSIEDVEVISTGSLSVDLATGVGGLPKGRIVEIYGPESSGKTSITLSCIAQAQKSGGIAALVDAEHALDPKWATKLGVNVNDLYVAQPNNGEEALEIVENLVRSNAFDIIVVDSVAALVPRSEIEGNMGDSQMGVQARLMSQALRKLTGVISKSNTVVVFINQIRLKIGVMFGNPETTTGGQALKFYASLRLDIRKIGALKSGTDIVGNRVKVKVVKNKMAAPFKEVEFDMIFDEPGVFSLAGEILDIGQNYGVVTKTGNTYTLDMPGSDDTIKLGIGRESAKKGLMDSGISLDDIRAAIVKDFKDRMISGDTMSTQNTPEENSETDEK